MHTCTSRHAPRSVMTPFIALALALAVAAVFISFIVAAPARAASAIVVAVLPIAGDDALDDGLRTGLGALPGFAPLSADRTASGLQGASALGVGCKSDASAANAVA